MPPAPAVRLAKPSLTLSPLLLAIACLLLGLGAGAGAADAQARRPAASTCPAAAHAHATHASCPKRSHARRPQHPHRSTRPHAKRHGRHGKRRAGSGSTRSRQQGETTTPAVCEDGSAPSASGPAGSFTCDDGSEPACENGSEPTATTTSPSTGNDGGGAKLVCAPDPDTGPSFGEGCEAGSEAGGCSTQAPPICEDGSTAIWSRQGYYTCRYGEPTCAAGSQPAFSSNGSILYCEPAAEGAGSGGEEA